MCVIIGRYNKSNERPYSLLSKEKIIMAVRSAKAVWNGTLREGAGNMKLGSGAFDGPFSFATRFGDEVGANPEELIGAAHAGCFSMFLSALLSGDGYNPTRIETNAKVHLGRDETGPVITLIELVCEAEVPDLSEEDFQEKVATAKANCPISRALAATEMEVTATLL
jgi:osmotically inducible protein OsmC